MPEAVPILWTKKFDRRVLTPLAVLRVQASKVKELSDGLLDAAVITTEGAGEEGKPVQTHSFEISAPALDHYTRSILTAEHDNPGAYPVSVTSWYLAHDRRNSSLDETPCAYCQNQDEFVEAIKKVLQSARLTGFLESLIAQINDAEAVTTSV